MSFWYWILTKTESKRKDFHPNGIEVGNSEVRGILKNNPETGKQLYLYDSYGRVISWTSKVVKYEDETLETENSIYKIQKLFIA